MRNNKVKSLQECAEWWNKLGNKDKDKFQRECGINRNYTLLSFYEIKKIYDMQTLNSEIDLDLDLKKLAEDYADLYFPKKDTEELLTKWLGIRVHYYSALKLQKDKYQVLVDFANKVKNWETPRTGKKWDLNKPLSYDNEVSYEAEYGSNGVRDYFKNLAVEVLKKL